MNNAVMSESSQPPTTLSMLGSTPILTITEEAFIFKGVTITDAGKAHTAWMEVMNQVNHRELLKEVYYAMIRGGFSEDDLLRRVKEASL